MLKKSRIPIIEAVIKKMIINEAKSMNIEQPHSNLYIKGWGFDTNGNWRILVGFPNDKGFKIQTNGNLPQTNNITRRTKKLTDEELDIIGKEITAYVEKHGTPNVKSRLRKYNGN